MPLVKKVRKCRFLLLCRGTKSRIASWEIHLRIPSRVLFFAPAMSAVSSTMQLKTFRLGCSGVRSGALSRPPSGRGRGGKVLRRILKGRVKGTAGEKSSSCICSGAAELPGELAGDRCRRLLGVRAISGRGCRSRREHFICASVEQVSEGKFSVDHFVNKA